MIDRIGAGQATARIPSVMQLSRSAAVARTEVGDPHGSELGHRETGHAELNLARMGYTPGRCGRGYGGMHVDARLMFSPAEHVRPDSTGHRWPDHTTAGKHAVDPTLVHRHRR